MSAESPLLTERSWSWLETRIAGLLTAPQTIVAEVGGVPSTRLGWALDPPKSSTNQS